MAVVLDFEKPIVEIQKKIDELKKMSEASGMDLDNQIQTFEQQAQDYKKELYSKLKPSQDILNDQNFWIMWILSAKILLNFTVTEKEWMIEPLLAELRK